MFGFAGYDFILDTVIDHTHRRHQQQITHFITCRPIAMKALSDGWWKHPLCLKLPNNSLSTTTERSRILLPMATPQRGWASTSPLFLGVKTPNGKLWIEKSCSGGISRKERKRRPFFSGLVTAWVEDAFAILFAGGLVLRVLSCF